MQKLPSVILAIDTSTRSTRVGCGRLSEGQAYAWTHSTPSEDRHGTALIPAIEEVMQGETAELIAVANGPGSFTGLRVGLAAVKALSFVWEVPVISVSSLTAVGYQALKKHPDKTELLVYSDAGRGEVFWARYVVRALNLEERSQGIKLPPRLVLKGEIALTKVPEFLERLQHEDILSVGPALKEDVRQPCLQGAFRETPDAIGEQAALAYVSGAPDESDAIEPHYVRAVDAKLPS